MADFTCACASADCLTRGCRRLRDAGVINSRQHGCICPPGAEKTCQGMLCPRRGYSNATAIRWPDQTPSRAWNER